MSDEIHWMSGHKPELELCPLLNDKLIYCGTVQHVYHSTDLYKRVVQDVSELSSLHPLDSAVGSATTYPN
jgi:hypothetical protein